MTPQQIVADLRAQVVIHELIGNAGMQRVVTASAAADTIEAQQAEIERLRSFIADFADNRFERIERRAHDPQDDLDPVTDCNAIDAWQDDARAVLEVKP